MTDPTTEMQAVPLQAETLSDADRAVLEVAKLNRKLAIANAETALAKNEASDVSFKNTVLQLYLKYQLNTELDAIDEQGFIKRNALAKKENAQ